MTPALFLGAILACGVGSTLRYAISRLGRNTTFPWPTMVSNIVGSALMGTVAAAVVVGGAPVGWLIVLGGGLAGGLSTFSTFAVDAVLLWRDERPRVAVLYLAASLVAGLAAAGIGWWSGVTFL